MKLMNKKGDIVESRIVAIVLLLILLIVLIGAIYFMKGRMGEMWTKIASVLRFG